MGRWLAAGAAALVVFVVVALVVLQSQAGRSVVTADSGRCSPQPCADANGFVVRVSDVSDQRPLVTMTVSFSVHGRTQARAGPGDFRLVDSAGRTYRAVLDDSAGCQQWQRTPIADGATLGPLPLCFQAVGATGPLKVRWSPVQGPFNTTPGYQIAL
jgi:hypothetical protein